MFAKRKKNIFKGPMLNTSPRDVSGGSSSGSGAVAGRTGSHSRSTSLAGRRSGEAIQEEDENEIEEVDAFSPLSGPGEVEHIFAAGETPVESPR